MVGGGEWMGIGQWACSVEGGLEGGGGIVMTIIKFDFPIQYKYNLNLTFIKNIVKSV